MLPDNRLIRYQESLISKLSKYLHLLHSENNSIIDEDIEKLILQTAAGKELTDEIKRIDKVITACIRDLKANSLDTDQFLEKYEKNRSAVKQLISEIDNQTDENQKSLSSLKGSYSTRINSVKASLSSELKILHANSFPDSSEFLDIKV